MHRAQEPRRHRSRSGALGLLAGLAAFGPSGATAEDSLDGLRRSLREHLFLNARLGLSQRQAIYAENAEPGAKSASQLRVHVNAAATELGDFGGYLGAGFIGRLTRDEIGDPFRDAYDDFEVGRNLRLFNAYVEYKLRDSDRRETLSLRAGRLATLDARSGLLLCDGLLAKVALGRNTSIEAYGGRHAVLDGGFSNQRTDFAMQLCAGAKVRARLEMLTLEGGYRLEGAHRPGLSASVDLGAIGLALGAEAIISTERRDGESPAILISHDGDFRSTSGRFGVLWGADLQLGQDPRPFGRGTLTPREADLAAARQLSIAESTLDRLFFGTAQPNLRAEASAELWPLEWLAIEAGAFGRLILKSEEKQNLRPQLFEVWGGPQLAFAAGYRLGVEARYSAQDAGEPTRLFAASGDGERSRVGVGAHAEVPFAIGESMSLALRPMVEANWTATRGPLSKTEGQAGIAAGAVVAWSWDQAMRFAARYDVETLPEFVGAELSAVHGVEVWLEGSY